MTGHRPRAPAISPAGARTNRRRQSVGARAAGCHYSEKHTTTRPVSSPESAAEPSPCPHQGPLPTPPHHNHNSPPLPSSATRLSSRHRPRARARARGGLDQQGVLVTAFPGALGLRVARKARFPRYKCDPKALAERSPAAASSTSSGMASGGAFRNLRLAVLCLALTSSVCTLITIFAAVCGPMISGDSLSSPC